MIPIAMESSGALQNAIPREDIMFCWTISGVGRSFYPTTLSGGGGGAK